MNKMVRSSHRMHKAGVQGHGGMSLPASKPVKPKPGNKPYKM